MLNVTATESPETSASALQLDYLRDIPRERLVQTSLDEMRRLGADEAQLKRWESDLRRVFPDVKAGESIVLEGAFMLKAQAEKARGGGEEHEH